jgi:hypothetical protein
MLESLKWDTVAQSCHTNFQDSVVETVGQIIIEILEKDGWELKKSDALSIFDEKDSEKIFNAFMENSEFIVTLKKKINEQKYEFKNVVIKFDFTENEKKEIAETYVDTILVGLCYINVCIFPELDEENAYEISKILSDDVYELLSPDEIENKFKDKIEEVIDTINKYNDEDNFDDYN